MDAGQKGLSLENIRANTVFSRTKEDGRGLTEEKTFQPGLQ
jgi:hypothetical protein